MSEFVRKVINLMSKDIIFTQHELWVSQVASFNFELDEEQLLRKALEVGFVTKIGDDKYLMNNDY